MPPGEHEMNTSQASHPGPRRQSHWQWRFWAIFIGQALSLVGSSLTQFVLLWWITDTTGSVSALAIAGLVALLPQALLSPLGGVLADRLSRRALMIMSDLVSALCMVVLIVLFQTGQIALWHIYTLMFVRSAMQAFQAPAAAASVAMLVPEAFLPRAAGLNQGMQSVTLIAAAPLGALAISLMPLGWALGIDVLTALLAIVPLLRYRIPQPRQAAQRGLGGFAREFRDGLRAVWDDAVLRHLYLLLGAVVLVIMPSFTLVPLLVKEHFGGGAPQVALMEGLAGAGMAAGGLLVAALAPRRQMPWILGGFAASCLTMALTSLSPSSRFGLAVVFWSISGMTFTLANAPLTALLQLRIPNRLQGRALSLLNMVTGLAAPVGLALATPLGEWLGIRWLFVAMGALGAVISLGGFLSPHLMRAAAAPWAGTQDR